MRITIAANDLTRGLEVCRPFIPACDPRQVLKGVGICTYRNRITFRATDGREAAEHNATVIEKEPGVVARCLPTDDVYRAAEFAEQNAGREINISVTERNILMTAAHGRLVSGLMAQDPRLAEMTYPDFDRMTPERNRAISLAPAVVLEMLDQLGRRPEKLDRSGGRFPDDVTFDVAAGPTSYTLTCYNGAEPVTGRTSKFAVGPNEPADLAIAWRFDRGRLRKMLMAMPAHVLLWLPAPDEPRRQESVVMFEDKVGGSRWWLMPMTIWWDQDDS